MNLQFETGKFITLKASEEHATHVVVIKNKIFKTNVYYEYYNYFQEEDLNNRIHDLTIKYNYIFDQIKSNDMVIGLVNTKNHDYVKIFCDRDENGNKFYELYLIEQEILQ
jgi:hypothetical protein